MSPKLETVLTIALMPLGAGAVFVAIAFARDNAVDPWGLGGTMFGVLCFAIYSERKTDTE